jgi:flagellar hook protein FlgE
MVNSMDALGTATSGLRAAQLQVDIAAENVANTNTPGYTPSGIAQQAVPGGVDARVVAGQAPPQLPGVAPGDQPSGTDLTTETVSQITGSIAYAANARVIDVSAQLTKNLIDVLA